MQAAAMLLPVIGLSYFMAGGWEEAEGNVGADVIAHDSTTLVVIHAVLLAFPIFMGLFTLFATIYMWIKARREEANLARVVASEKIGIEEEKRTAADQILESDAQSWSSWSSWNANNTKAEATAPLAEDAAEDASQDEHRRGTKGGVGGRRFF